MLGYCTNVHRGDSFDAVIQNLQSFASRVQRNLQTPLGVGLWISDKASREVDTPLLVDTLDELHLEAFTLNGFPFSNFHHDIVQRDVYKPNWSVDSRLQYTIALANILSAITTKNQAGISTLPLGWNDDTFSNDDCAAQLTNCIDSLERIEQQTGKCIHLDIETEPGCRLQTSKDLCNFFVNSFKDDERSRKYIRVCHDTCHSAVMRENIDDCIANYDNAGLSIGKVQLSSAIEFNFASTDISSTRHILTEPTYLHQTTIGSNDDFQFFDTFSDVPSTEYMGLCRVHFHVPIHVKHFGDLQTTQNDLLTSIQALKNAGVTDWEVETYTWDVTPDDLQEGDLVTSITEELAWAKIQLNK
jgi:hypothetical protein